MNPLKLTEDSRPYEKIVQGISNVAREIKRKEFQDTTESEISELVLPWIRKF